jgi:hypothetical protein
MHRSRSKLRFLVLGLVLSTTVGFTEQPLILGEQSYIALPAGLSAFALPSVMEYRAQYIFDLGSKLNYPGNMSLRSLQATTAPPKPPQPPAEKVERAPINPSMVGYIDEAGIYSEVRVRFDAALDDTTPDRAEFFYGKCGCYRYITPTTNPAYDPNSPGPGNGIPKNINFQQLYFLGEYAHGSRISVFVELPFRWLQAVAAAPPPVLVFPNAGGIGDMHLGIKVAPLIFRNGNLTLQFRAMVPSGDASKGLGTNHASIEPSLLYDQRLSNRFELEAEIGDTHPLSSSAGVPTATATHGFAGDVFFYGIGPSYKFVNNEQLQAAGVLELVGWNVRSGYVTGTTNPNSSTAGVNIVNLKIGPRISFHGHQSVYFGYGIALTSQTWYHEIFRTEYRYTF